MNGFIPVFTHALVAAGLLAALLLCAVPADATEAEMAKLPVTNPFACLNCHTGDQADAPDTDLNDFGLAFLDNGRLWDALLAGEDSDGDGCTNGAEVGDVDGNGVPDQGVTAESSNPGAGDCSSASDLEELSWSELKNLFNGR